MMAINTVAAGGGSILHFDGVAAMRVGPGFSAGADPGPASYRRGGPLTVTDANVMVGKIQPAHFPHFRAGRRTSAGPCRRRRLASKFADLARDISRGHRGQPATRASRSPRVSCEIAVANMANAIKQVSVQKSGHDVTPASRCSASVAPAASTPAWSPTRWAWTRVFIHPLCRRAVRLRHGPGRPGGDEASKRSKRAFGPDDHAAAHRVGRPAGCAGHGGAGRAGRRPGRASMPSADRTMSAMPATRLRSKCHSARGCGTISRPRTGQGSRLPRRNARSWSRQSQSKRSHRANAWQSRSSPHRTLASPSRH